MRTHTSQDPDAIQLGVSAILGSGMVAFLLAPGVCAISASKPLVLKRRPLLRDIGFYTLSLCGLVYFFYDGVVYSYEAGVLIGLWVPPSYLRPLACSIHLTTSPPHIFWVPPISPTLPHTPQ